MNKKIILGLIFVVLVSGCGKDSDPKKDVCSWKAGDCDMVIDLGYYFDSDEDRCKLFSVKSACSQTPFETLEQCIEICEK
jgi:hypothetical protein